MVLRKRGGNFLNLLQKEGVTRKGGGSNPGGNYEFTSGQRFLENIYIYLIVRYFRENRKETLA